MNFISPLISIILICLFAGSSIAQDFSEAIHRFDAHIQREIEAEHIVGLSAAAAYGDFSWSDAYGFADLENQVPAKVESSYRMASVSKPMTAAGILVLVEQGKIDLDAEVQKYVAYFPGKPWPLTVRHLLGHLGGISHYKDYLAEANTTRQMSTREALSIFADWDLLHEPGTAFQYTTYGYNLLGAVMEGACGESYADFMTQQVWLPLGMLHTSVDYLDEIIPNRVRGYRRENNKILNAVPVNTSLKIAGGGTRSTVGDMIRFARGLSAGKLLSEESCEMMWTSMITRDGTATGYGMGWNESSLNGHFSVSHSGGQEGTRTYLIHLPAIDFTVAIASNYEASNPGQIAHRLARELLGYPLDAIDLYTGNWMDASRQDVLRQCFELGSAYVERYGKALTNDPGRIRNAFAYLNRFADDATFSNSPDRGADQISGGTHTRTDRAFLLAGSYIAAELKAGEKNSAMAAARTTSPLYFYDAYFDLSPKSYARLDPQWKRLIKSWVAVWEHFPGRNPAMTAVDTEVLREQLRVAFQGRRIYPDYAAHFITTLNERFVQGDLAGAIRMAETAIEFYPKSADAVGYLGILRVVSGDQLRGEELIRSSIKLNENGVASQNSLNTMAYQLAGIGQLDAAERLLSTAVENYPSIANLQDSLGEIYLMQGDTTNAVKAYRQALKIDPGFDNAKVMLKRILGD